MLLLLVGGFTRIRNGYQLLSSPENSQPSHSPRANRRWHSHGRENWIPIIVDTGTVEPFHRFLHWKSHRKKIMFSSGYFLYKHPCIFVNEAGKRFCNETAYHQLVSPLLLRQKSAFIIFDDKTKKDCRCCYGIRFQRRPEV